jgi:hypothetical protein
MRGFVVLPRQGSRLLLRTTVLVLIGLLFSVGLVPTASAAPTPGALRSRSVCRAAGSG